jgi:calcium homeostasis ER protein
MRTPEFEAKLREKEQGNPKFSFLFGGENSDYYQWKVYCLRNPGAGM